MNGHGAWPEELNELIRCYAPGHSEAQIVAEAAAHGYDLTTIQVRCAKKRLKVRSGTKGRQRGAEKSNSLERRYPGIYARLAEIAPGRTHAEISEIITGEYGREFTPTQTNAALKRHGIKTGNDGRYKKGQKVIRPEGWKMPQTPGMIAHRYKKGHKPDCWAPVGTERERDGILWRKTAEPRTWRQVHRIIWEETHGQKIPTNCAIIFLDGNTKNITPDNLACVSKNIVIKITQKGYKNGNAEITAAAITLERLKQEIRRLQDERQGTGSNKRDDPRTVQGATGKEERNPGATD